MGVRAILIASLGSYLCLCAETLPIRSYSTADGLAANQVNRVVVDSHGFVWLLTPSGLSRFDGYRMTNFTTAEGLPGRSVNALLETRSGVYFAGTARGLCQFRTGPGSNQFAVGSPGPHTEAVITALAESSDGRVWCGTYHGSLFEVLPGLRFRRQALATPPTPDNYPINDIAGDSCGKLWISSVTGISVLARDGSVRTFTEKDGLPGSYANTVFRAKDGTMWAGFRGGFASWNDGCISGQPGVRQTYPSESARRGTSRDMWNVLSFAEASDGALWAATANGILRLFPERGGALQRLTRAEGLSDRTIYALAADPAGNLWVGTEGAGAMLIEPGGFTTYRERDGLASDRVWSVFGDRSGNVLTVAVRGQEFALNLFDGARFRAIEGPQVFTSYEGRHAWGMHRILLQSRAGDWWAATAGGLCQYGAGAPESLRNKAPQQCFFRDYSFFQVYEDSHGAIWASAQISHGMGDLLVRWDPSTRSAASLAEWPKRTALVKSFAEDRQGNLWLGWWDGGVLSRYDGRQFTHFQGKDGVPAGTIYDLLTDSQGRIWLASETALAVVENPSAATLRFRRFDQSSGLSNSSVRAVLGDREGYIYAATGSGVDRLDPGTGHIKHFSAADGVALGQMESAFRDSAGNLWFATAQGLSRLTPSATPAPLRPSILITALQAGGASWPVSQRGETSISGIQLDPYRNQLQVEFVALAGEPEANLRYAYRLEGGDGGWSPPLAQHSVNFAALGAGHYRFLVKAINSDGQESPAPAVVSFTVLPPFWRRGWFEALALGAVVSVVYLLHSYRVAHIVSLERMRMAIATDLHDDIGSSLSQIAVLSEVARAGVNGENRRTQESLQKVAVLAREMVDSMSDIVWSIHAAPEGLDSLIARMREFALDLLAGQRIAFDLRSAADGPAVHHLGLQARRQLFLMFKECLHNAARHSGCTVVKAELKAMDREIVLIVEDNGRGIDPAQPAHGRAGGHGIPGMKTRAETLGGSVEVVSLPGSGCTVCIRLPLKRSPFAWFRA